MVGLPTPRGGQRLSNGRERAGGQREAGVDLEVELAGDGRRGRHIEVDECPKCGGVWLDSGELLVVHSQFKTESDKQKATEQMINEVFAKDMESLRNQTKEQLQTANKVYKALQYITPSHYLKKIK